MCLNIELNWSLEGFLGLIAVLVTIWFAFTWDIKIFTGAIALFAFSYVLHWASKDSKEVKKK